MLDTDAIIVLAPLACRRLEVVGFFNPPDTRKHLRQLISAAATHSMVIM
jgi:hypothetical protein